MLRQKARNADTDERVAREDCRVDMGLPTLPEEALIGTARIVAARC